MVKRIISFTQPQLDWLEAEAKRLDISLPELVRRIIDQARGAHEQKK